MTSAEPNREAKPDIRIRTATGFPTLFFIAVNLVIPLQYGWMYYKLQQSARNTLIYGLSSLAAVNGYVYLRWKDRVKHARKQGSPKSDS
jgi:hypothetical protein